MKKRFIKVTDEHVLFSSDKNKVSIITNRNISEINTYLKRYNYKESEDSKNNYGSFEKRDCEKEVDGRRCQEWSHDRMAFLEIQTYRYSDTWGCWLFAVIAKAYGKRRYCNKYWRRYYTNLTMRNVNCRILYAAKRIGTAWDLDPIDVSIVSGSRTVNNRRRFLMGPIFFQYVEYGNGATPPLPVLINIEGEASSRGVGSEWTDPF